MTYEFRCQARVEQAPAGKKLFAFRGVPEDKMPMRSCGTQVRWHPGDVEVSCPGCGRTYVVHEPLPVVTEKSRG